MSPTVKAINSAKTPAPAEASRFCVETEEAEIEASSTLRSGASRAASMFEKAIAMEQPGRNYN